MVKEKIMRILTVVMVGMIVLGNIQGLCQETKDKDLVGYWKFDEGKGETAKDSSGNKNDGDITAQWAKGSFGTCLYFDGQTNAVVVPDNQTLRFGKSDFTIELWICPLVFDESQYKTRRLIDKANYPQVWWNIDMIKNGQIEMEMVFKPEGAEKTTGGATVSNGSLLLNKWTHLVIVNDRKNLKTKYYFNGNLDSTKDINPAFTAELNVEDKDLIIGGAWQPFIGLMDEIKIYKRALTDQEIKTSYEKEKGNRANPKYTVLED